MGGCVSSLKVKSGGSWLDAKELWVRSNGVWVKKSQLNYKYSGAWANLNIGAGIPANMVILYPSASNLTTAEQSLIAPFNGYFPRGASSSILSLGGTLTHTGSSHGSASGTTSPTEGPNGANKSGDTAHLHNIPSHSHTGIGNHTPLSKTVVPIVGAQEIRAGALFFSAASLGTLFSLLSTYDGYYICFSSVGGETTGAHTHSHGGTTVTVSGTTLTSGGGSNSMVTTGIAANQRSGTTATHTVTLTDNSSNNPKYISLNMMSYAGSTLSALGAIPVGAIALFTSTELPPGWSVYNSATDRLIKASATAGTMDGVDSHSLQCTGTSSSPSSTSTSGGTLDNCYGSKYHSHGCSVSHTGMVEFIPPYVNLCIGIKVS